MPPREQWRIAQETLHVDAWGASSVASGLHAGSSRSAWLLPQSLGRCPHRPNLLRPVRLVFPQVFAPLARLLGLSLLHWQRRQHR